MKYVFWTLVVVSIVVISYLIWKGKKDAKLLQNNKALGINTIPMTDYEKCAASVKFIPGVEYLIDPVMIKCKGLDNTIKK